MPHVGIRTWEEVMLIELSDTLTGKCNFLQIFRSTKFSEVPESSKTLTGKSSNSPSTTAGLRLEGALARYGFSIDKAQTSTLDNLGLDSDHVFD